MRLLLYLIILFWTLKIFPQSTFQKTFGGSNSEFFWSLQPTSDGGYILVGNTSSFGPSNSNIYLIKTNSHGDTLWTKAFGGSLSESGLFVQQTNDGGYIVAGSTYSFGNGSNADGYLVKTDSIGNLLWSKTYGGTLNDNITIVRQTYDGGYILLGSTSSFGTSAIDFDVYLIKTDPNGDTLWTKTLGNTGSDNASYLQQTLDSGYVITGNTNSFGAGQDDVFLMKTDNNGSLLWTKTYGGVDSEVGSCVEQTIDGGYIVIGKTHSFGAFSNDGDVYLIKTNNIGDTLWTKTFGGAGTDWGHSVKQTSDGGFILVGETWSFGAGRNDVYLLKADSRGNLIWSKTFGGTNLDHAFAVHQNNDGSFIIGGYSFSFGVGGGDFYLIKTDSAGNSWCNENNAATITTIPTTQSISPTVLTSTIASIVTTPFTLLGSGSMINSLCNNVGINEINTNNSILIYPNPLSIETTIKTTIDLIDATLTLYNLNGKKVKQIKNISGNTIILLRDNLASGFYFLSLTNDNGVITTEKLIISD